MGTGKERSVGESMWVWEGKEKLGTESMWERWGQGKRMTSVGEMLGTGKESVWVCGYVGKERVQGFKKVQTRLTALVQRRFKGSNKVQTRLTALVQ